MAVGEELSDEDVAPVRVERYTVHDTENYRSTESCGHPSCEVTTTYK